MSIISSQDIRLGGVSEIAQELGLSRQRVSQLRESPGFPAAIGEISAGPIWDLNDVARWNTSGLRRSSGRPSNQDPLRTLGRFYRIDDQPIGSGGFADVYRAVDTRRKPNHRHSVVAIKILRGLDDIEVRRRFKREIRLVADCKHPGVVRILDSGEDENDRLWYAMPLAKGSLADELDEFVGNEKAILEIMQQLCAALSYLHELGIFHRDIKPGNILRTSKSRWAISDFGLAREAERKTTALTSTHRGVGTFVYAAPETWKDAKSAGAPADIFGLGRVLQHLVTGELPVGDNQDLALFRTVVTKATRLDPTKRYDSADEMLVAIGAAVKAPENWRSEEETADELANRLQLESPDDSSIAELISQFEASTPTEAMETLHCVIPRMSSGAIRIAWRSHQESFSHLLEAYADTVATSGYKWDFCDTIAGFWDRAVRISNDEHVLYLATKALLGLGEHHNRWHVRDVLIEILQRIRDKNHALNAAEALRETSPMVVAWSLERFVIRSLHPAIRDEAERILKKTTKRVSG
ncbi:MAG: serine/threonine-protein kinase [Acidimicrobiaceae bacterium]|nr:serine/threonine protein kinase [Acidimicrobiia bacterium]MCY4492566.1 serine/threonine-protein kinase [Acidimicrobiaceae bacterium]